MAKRLTEYLEQIGREIHDRGHVYADGTVRPITKDEMLAREVWRRALGHEQETTNEDGSVSHRIYPPDPKMQQFIFERREGKIVTPQEEKSIELLDKISEIARSQLNTAAEDIVKDDRDDNTTDSE